MEVTARVRKAAAEALMEANEKLRAAEEAQAAMAAEVQRAEELHKVCVQAMVCLILTTQPATYGMSVHACVPMLWLLVAEAFMASCMVVFKMGTGGGGFEDRE